MKLNTISYNFQNTRFKESYTVGLIPRTVCIQFYLSISNPRSRRHQMEQMMDRLEKGKAFKNADLVIVGGDLNEEPGRCN